MRSGATPKDFRVLPDKIILVRHAESEGNVDNMAYTYSPDSQVPLVSGTALRLYCTALQTRCRGRMPGGAGARPWGLGWLTISNGAAGRQAGMGHGGWAGRASEALLRRRA